MNAKRSIAVTANLFLLACLTALLTGCSLPYLKTAQESYRTDPVIVQYQRIRSGSECFNPGKPENEQRAMLAETLCPIDLDTYVFPSDRGSPGDKTAYIRLLECQKNASATRYRVDVDKARGVALATREFARRTKAISDDKVQKLSSREAVLIRKMTAIDAQLEKLEKKKETGSVRQSKAVLADSKKMYRSEMDALSKQITDAEATAAAGNVAMQTADLAVETAQAESRAIDAQVSAAPRGIVDAETCRALRNFLQDEIITRSTQMCKKHLSDVSATSAILNADLGFLSLVASTLGTVVGGVQAKTNLAGVAGASSATQALLNKEVYRDFIVPAITKAIQSDRDRKLQEILADQTKDVVSYSISRAVVEANDFHERCAFAHGLLLLSADAEKRTPPRIEELEAQVRRNYEQITEADKSIKLVDDSSNGRLKSTDKEIEQVQKTKERLRQDIDAILVRINLMKRTQNTN